MECACYWQLTDCTDCRNRTGENIPLEEFMFPRRLKPRSSVEIACGQHVKAGNSYTHAHTGISYSIRVYVPQIFVAGVKHDAVLVSRGNQPVCCAAVTCMKFLSEEPGRWLHICGKPHERRKSHNAGFCSTTINTSTVQELMVGRSDRAHSMT